MSYFCDKNRINVHRYFLGGTQIQQRQDFLNDNIDLRGFPGGRYSAISPVNDDNIQIGGTSYTKYTMELRYPAVSSEQLQLIPYVFMDAGNAYRELRDFDLFNVIRSVDVGTYIFLSI